MTEAGRLRELTKSIMATQGVKMTISGTTCSRSLLDFRGLFGASQRIYILVLVSPERRHMHLQLFWACHRWQVLLTAVGDSALSVQWFGYAWGVRTRGGPKNGTDPRRHAHSPDNPQNLPKQLQMAPGCAPKTRPKC